MKFFVRNWNTLAWIAFYAIYALNAALFIFVIFPALKPLGSLFPQWMKQFEGLLILGLIFGTSILLGVAVMRKIQSIAYNWAARQHNAHYRAAALAAAGGVAGVAAGAAFADEELFSRRRHDDSSMSTSDMFSGGYDAPVINPSTGLPMIDGIGSVDVHGNAYGTDFFEHTWDSSNSWDSGSSWDSCNSWDSGSSWDSDSFSSSSSSCD